MPFLPEQKAETECLLRLRTTGRSFRIALPAPIATPYDKITTNPINMVQHFEKAKMH